MKPQDVVERLEAIGMIIGQDNQVRITAGQHGFEIIIFLGNIRQLWGWIPKPIHGRDACVVRKEK